MKCLLSRINKHFYTRISFYVICTVLVLFSVIGVTANYFSTNLLHEQTLRTNSDNLIIMSSKIKRILERVELITHNYVDDFESCDYQKVDSLLIKMNQKNPDIFLISASYEPNYFRNNQLTAKAIDNINFSVYEFGSYIDYDYRYYDWYQIPKLIGKAYWTEPYVCKAESRVVTTYSVPLYCKEKHEFIGCLTIDVPLDEMIAHINKEKTIPESKLFVISRNGNFLLEDSYTAHNNENIFTSPNYNSDFYEMGIDMVQQKSGNKKLIINNNKHLVSYGPLTKFGWSVAIAIPTQVINYPIIMIVKQLTLLSLISLIIILIVITYAIYKTSIPLTKISELTKQIAKGNFNIQLPNVKHKDEIYQLTQSFGDMQTQLMNHIHIIKETTKNQERLNSELRIALQIQNDILPTHFPSSPNLLGLDIYGYLKPANEIGGDLFDYCIIDNQLFFSIGDVSGKGIPGALHMIICQRASKGLINMNLPIDKIMYNLNNILLSSGEVHMFTTYFLGKLDIETGKLTYCNAGHNPPLIKRDGIVKEIPVVPNMALGVIKNYEYKLQEIHIPLNSSLFIYTDGVTEAENNKFEFYNYNRVKHFIKNHNTLRIKDLILKLVQDIDIFKQNANQSDDLTLFGIHYQKPYCLPYNTNEKYLEIKACIDNIPEIKKFTDEIAKAVQMPHKEKMDINLALEEAISNIIFYGYKNEKDAKEHTIIVEAKISTEKIIFNIKDSGIAFNPLENKDPDITLSTEEREMGGLGIYIIKQLMNQVTYQRIENHNLLTLKKTRIKK